MNLMIDLETLGTSNKCPVISIGACFFDTTTKQILSKFYVALDVKHQIDSGLRKPDADTIKWWMSQSGAAKRVFKENAVDVRVALEAFVKFVYATTTIGKVKPWGNGSGFDINIMESLLTDYGIKIPWIYWNVRDLRTFKEYIGNNKKLVKSGVNHNALDDAVSQAQYVLDNMK